MDSNVNFKIESIKEINNGKKYKVSIYVPTKLGWIDNVNFVIEDGNKIYAYKLNHQKNEDGKALFETEVELSNKAIYRYYFSYFIDGMQHFCKKQKLVDNYIIRDEMFKMSVNFNVPDWAKGKIMYHIFVDRYNRGSEEKLKIMPRRFIYNSWEDDMILVPINGIWNSDFYGGDLKGIVEKLDYIKSLGVSILYLSPVVWSQSNHRYDTSDYENVDPYAGCNLDLKILCEEAHKRGINVVLDAVFNHTGNDSKYFNEYNTFDTIGAFQSNDSQYASFYKKHYDNGKLYYDYWWGMPNLPVCDGYSKAWQEYITGENGIIDKWFNLGIDGLRIDVADELTDDFIEKIRIAVHRNKEDGFILGEVWKNPMRMNRGYIESGKGMDSVMNYSLIDALIRYFKYGDINKVNYIIKDILNEYPTDTINTLMNFTSTHDISRAINIFGSNDFNEYSEWAWNIKNDNLDYCKNFKLTREQYETGKAIYQAYVFILAFFPGILSIFYGDEAGLEGLGNLANRKPFPWNKEDKELLKYFREIGQIRQQESFLEQAELKVLDINKNYFMFERVKDDKKVLITVNRTNIEQVFKYPNEYYDTDKVYVLKKSSPGVLAPYGGIALVKRK